MSHWAKQMSHPQFIWMLLALASTFAGNLTMFGSVANVIVAQGAHPRAPLVFGDFLRAGVPITLVTTAVGVLLLWGFWGWGGYKTSLGRTCKAIRPSHPDFSNACE